MFKQPQKCDKKCIALLEICSLVVEAISVNVRGSNYCGRKTEKISAFPQVGGSWCNCFATDPGRKHPGSHFYKTMLSFRLCFFGYVARLCFLKVDLPGMHINFNLLMYKNILR